MRLNFLKVSIALAIVLMVVMAGTASGQVQASQPAQATAAAGATMAATEAAGARAASDIHAGAKGVAGPVVVPLAPPDKFGKSTGCTTGVPRDLITQILTMPYNFYVNVHTSDFPGGAARGQIQPPPQ